MPGFSATTQRTNISSETWYINFAGSTAGALGSTSTKQYGTIYRTQGQTSVATGTLPFYLSRNEAAMIIDLYVTAVPANGGDAAFDIEISNTSQKLNWDVTSMLYSSNSRPRIPAPGIPVSAITQAAFALYWIVAQTTAASVTVIAHARVSPVRG